MYYKKYQYSFKDLNNIQFTVEIWQNKAVTGTTEIIGDQNPLIINYPDIQSKFEVIRGSGCAINLLSTYDRQFIDLYTSDIFEFQVRIYKEQVLYWIGYLDSELYNEVFNEISNYQVSFSCSCGMALLERLYYINTDGSKYQGITSQFNAIATIIQKLGLDYEGIYISLSTTSNNLSIGASETILHKSYCNNQNWYNEDGEAETCRNVLTKILQPYAGVIFQDNARLIITDVNTLAKKAPTSFKKYDANFNYLTTTTIDLNLGDLSTRGFYDSNQQLNIVSGYNKQVLIYSPYIQSKLIDFTKTDFSGEVTYTTYGSSPYRWTETTYLNSGSWDRTAGTFASYQGADTQNQEKQESYLKLGMSAGIKSFSYKKELPYIIPANSKILIKAKAFVRTTDDLDNEENTTKKVYQLKIKTRLKIADSYYNRVDSFTKGWTTNSSATLDFNFERQTIVVDKIYKTVFDSIDNDWIDLKVIGDNGRRDEKLEIKTFDYSIPLNSGFSGGVVEFDILDWDILAEYNAQQAINHDAVYNSVKDVRLKDLQLIVVDAKGNELSNEDVEYIGYMNAGFKNASPDITTYQGTSKTQNSCEKAAIMGYNGSYYFLNSWTREGKTSVIENLLLRSIISNYTNKTLELQATINSCFSVCGVFTYQKFIPDKVFMIVGSSYNVGDASQTLRLQEINIDNLEINETN